MKTLGVIGLGYVGLPLAVQAAEKGYKVIGIDYNTSLVRRVNDRISPYANDNRFEKALHNIKLADDLKATSDYSYLRDVDTIIICVPTPTENNIPDLSLVEKAAEQIGKELRKGQFVCLESTVNPGVTRNNVLPILERESGLKVGKDFYLAHCPERIDPGNDTYFVGNLNRVVGGITKECTEIAVQFYSSIIDANLIPLGSTEEAEFVKSWENSHRNVMIAMANSAAIISDALGMNINNILNGLQSKVDQFGLQLAKPGIGPGGHCIPEDIHYVIKIARENGIDTRFLDDAAELNDRMPKYAVHQLSMLVASHGEKLKDLRVVLLGLAYKPNIEDMRRSPSIEVAYELVRNAKNVKLYDPLVNTAALEIHGSENSSTLDDALRDADVLFIGTAHDAFKNSITPAMLKKYGIRYIYDGRNCLDSNAMTKNGIAYKGVGI